MKKLVMPARLGHTLTDPECLGLNPRFPLPLQVPAMSLFSWLFPAHSRRANKALPDSSGLSRVEATRPVGRSGPEGGSNAATSTGSNGQ
ncbi:MAG: hypothetical protein Q8R63_02400, partial [Ramlibacter sp.]|nr:hypothetical protein [Ramlibacter sp.]